MKTGLILGFFDGVHAGHRAVIESAFEYSDNVILVTFKESPAVYFGQKAEYIMSRQKSLEKIKSLGVHKIVQLDFSKIANMTAEQYLEYLIINYSPVSISTGFNHTFGFGKAGTPDFLYKNQNRYNYKYICVGPIVENNQTISSTLIRNLLVNGDIEKANKLLESKFTVMGNVISGKQIGRKIGFPTANLEYPANTVRIPYGVYKSVVHYDNKELKAITNWGMKPTLNNTLKPVLETHIFNFSGDLYGKQIEIAIEKRIRGEIKFDSLDELKTQITKDVQLCLE